MEDSEEMLPLMFEDPNDAPKADSTRYYKCDGCAHLHVALVDKDDNCYVTAIISREMLVHMLEVLDEEPTHKHAH